MKFTKSNVSYTAGMVYIAPFDPTDDIAMGMPAATLSVENDNVDAIAAYIEANYTFQRMAGFKNLSLSEAFENEVTDTVDDCDIGDWQKTADLIPSFTGDWLTTLDPTCLEILIGSKWFYKAGAASTGNTLIKEGAWSFGSYIRFPQQNRDANGIVIAPTTIVVTGSIDGATTDYELVTVSGEYGIIVNSGGALTSEGQDLTLSYGYTATDMAQTSYVIGKTIQPYMIAYVETCPDENGKSDEYYLIKCALSGSLDTNFISTGEVPLSSVTLQGAKGGRLIKLKHRVD